MLRSSRYVAHEKEKETKKREKTRKVKKREEGGRRSTQRQEKRRKKKRSGNDTKADLNGATMMFLVRIRPCEYLIFGTLLRPLSWLLLLLLPRG